MPVPTDLYTFSNGTPADAGQVNARFDPLYAALNGALDETNHVIPGVLSAYLTANVTVLTPLAALVKIPFNAEEFDTGGWFDTATGLYTPPAGYYRISWAATALAPIVANVCWTVLLKNGAAHKKGSLSPSNVLPGRSSGSAIVLANGTDTFGVALDQGSPTSPVAGGATETYMHAEQIGRA